METIPAPANVQAVFFDAVGTLIVPVPPPAEVYRDVGAIFGQSLDVSLIRKRFHAAFRRQEEIDRRSGWAVSEERERARWRAIVGETFEEGPNVDGIFDALFAHFARPNAWALSDGAAEILEWVRRQELTLGIASNFDARLNGIIDGLSALANVDHRVISSEIGWRKPSRAFFETVMRRANCAAEQIVFVGDRPDLDYAAAVGTGMVGVLYDPRDEQRDSTRRIRRLIDLPIIWTR